MMTFTKNSETVLEAAEMIIGERLQCISSLEQSYVAANFRLEIRDYSYHVYANGYEEVLANSRELLIHLLVRTTRDDGLSRFRHLCLPLQDMHYITRNHIKRLSKNELFGNSREEIYEMLLFSGGSAAELSNKLYVHESLIKNIRAESRRAIIKSIISDVIQEQFFFNSIAS